MTYYSKRQIDGDFNDIVARTIEVLQAESFGLLCEIDVQEKFKEKLDIEEFPQYRILGACNPPLAKEGIDVEPDLGTLLPCNVVVYETDDGDVVVSAVEAGTMLSVVDNPALDPIAEDVRERFDRVLDTLAAESE